MITASGQRSLHTIKWKKMTLSLQHFSIQLLPHLCSCQILYLFICSNSGIYPFLLKLTVKSLRVDQGLGTMSFNICYCTLVIFVDQLV